MRAPKVGSRRIFNAVGMDAWGTRHIQDGAVVIVVQPYGCPKNGTMGHCYVDAGDGERLVLLNSISERAS